MLPHERWPPSRRSLPQQYAVPACRGRQVWSAPAVRLANEIPAVTVRGAANREPAFDESWPSWQYMLSHRQYATPPSRQAADVAAGLGQACKPVIEPAPAAGQIASDSVGGARADAVAVPLAGGQSVP